MFPQSSHLEVSDGPGEGVLAQPPLLVQELAGFAVRRGQEEAVVEALSQLLCEMKKEIMAIKRSKERWRRVRVVIGTIRSLECWYIHTYVYIVITKNKSGLCDVFFCAWVNNILIILCILGTHLTTVFFMRNWKKGKSALPPLVSK